MKAVPERITVPTWASLIWGPYQFERPYWRHKYTHWYKELAQIPPLAAQEMFDDPKKNWCLTKRSMSLRWRPTIANLCKSLDTVNLTRPGDQQKQPFFLGSAASSWHQIAGILPKLAVCSTKLQLHTSSRKTHKTPAPAVSQYATHVSAAPIWCKVHETPLEFQMKAWMIHFLDAKYGSKSEVVSSKKSPKDIWSCDHLRKKQWYKKICRFYFHGMRNCEKIDDGMIDGWNHQSNGYFVQSCISFTTSHMLLLSSFLILPISSHSLWFQSQPSITRSVGDIYQFRNLHFLGSKNPLEVQMGGGGLQYFHQPILNSPEMLGHFGVGFPY